MNPAYSDIQYNCGGSTRSRRYRHVTAYRHHFTQDDLLREVSKYPPPERRKMLPVIRRAMQNGTWKGTPE